MADVSQNTDPGFFRYFTPEEVATVSSTQIKAQLQAHGQSSESEKDLIARCVALVGEARVLAAVKSQLPVPCYSWTSHTVIGIA